MVYKKQRAFTIVELPPSLKFRRASLVPNKNVKQGFTIVELLVVIVVIGILAAITIVSYTGISGKAIVSSVKSDIAQAYKQLEVSKTTSSTDVYPINQASANLKSSNGTTYTYYSDSPYKNYCLVATNNSTVYSISSSNPLPISGNCLSNGLVGYWALDNTTGMTDLSGNGNNGTASGGIAIGTAANHLGTSNKATAFDGVDDVIIGFTESNFDFAGSFSISCWAKLSAETYGFTKGIVAKNAGSSTGFMLGEFGSGWSFFVADKNVVSTTNWSLNVWHHIVGLYNSGDGKMHLYADGIEIGTPLPVTFVNNNDDLTIGRWVRWVEPERYWNGSISDVRIYNRALSQTEITNLYNSN
jgi:prepilin-type N-terminal cleavage/methylation domain-containing protein